MAILEINHLKKSFGQQTVLKDVHFSVKEHTIFGFIGQNGAGKTTTMKAILGLLKIDGGNITVCNEQINYGNIKPINILVIYQMFQSSIAL